VAAVGLQAADGVWTNAVSGNWSDTTKWADNIVAGDGGTAAFQAASGTFFVTNDYAAPVVLAGLSANTNAGAGAQWNIVGGTNELVAPAVINTRYAGDNGLSVRNSTLAGSDDILCTGLGRFFLGLDNLYTGRTIISNGNVRVARDSGFGPAPATLRADAIILDYGGLENDDNSFVLTNHPNRGITVTARGGFIGCGYTSAGMRIESPVTGPGFLGINFENCPVTLANPANDYAGGTVVGTNGPGANPLSCVLRLGQSEVLPHGAGKGGLKIGADSSHNNTLPTATLDLNGKTETVNTLSSGPRAALTSSTAGGRLSVGALDEDSDYRGTLASGATLEKRGAGTLRLAGATLTAGTVDAKAGTVVSGGPNLAAGATLLLDGADLTLTAPSGLYEYRGASAGNSPDLAAALTYTGWQVWPAKGTTALTAEFPNNTQFVYRGKWYVEEAGTYSFAKGFDDGGYLALDGVTVLSNAVTATRAVVNDVAVGAGWHTVEVRYSQGAGGVGPQFGFRNGILFDAQNGGFTNAAELARARMFTDDGGPDLVADGRDNVLAARVLLAQDATLTIGADAGNVVFAGSLLTNAVADPEPVLTVANGGAPLIFGSDRGTPAVLDVAVNSAGGVVFTNRVWLRRLPSGTVDIAAGADLALDGPALLGGPLTLTDYSVRVVRPDSVGGDGSVTANAGTAVWFDTMRYAEQALADSGATAVTYDNDVQLNGGTAQFTGAGTITYSGALTGSGNAVKTGAGDLLLTGTESALTGEIQINAGRLLPADEAALGGATVRLSGGKLANPVGADLTLATTPITAVTGGFEVSGGRTLTADGQVTGVGPVSKWGEGRLVLGGEAINTNLDLHVRAGSVELNKTGDASAYAVRHLLGVGTNLTVRLTGSNGNQIGGGVTLDGGILDLNGRNETIGVLTNTLAGGVVTNGGVAAATLTVGEGGGSSAFSGTLTDGAAGTLALAKIGSGALTIPTDSMRYSGGTAVEGGTLRLTLGVPVTAGLVYRLDASDASKIMLDGGKVTNWVDSTAAGYQFAQPAAAQQPEYVVNAINGLSAVRFGVSGSTRLVANKSATARTVFIVSKMLTYQSLAGVWGQDGLDRGIRHANDTSWRHTGNSADANDFSINGEMYIDGTPGFSWGSRPLHVMSAVSTGDKAWVNAIGNYWGPNDNNGKTRYLRGYIGEILVYNRTLTTAERQAIEAYLMSKWYGGASLPADRPLTVAPGATLAVQALPSLTLQTLAGGGTLAPEGGSTVVLTGYNTFTGAVAGAGTVAVRDATDADVRFVPQSFGVTVVNNGTQDKVLRVGTAVTGLFLGSVQDGSNALGIVHSGPGLTFFGGTNSIYTGDTVIENGMAIVGGAVSTRYVRFSPQMTRTSGAHTGTGYQLSEFQLLLNGVQVAYPAGTAATSEGKGAGAEGPEKAIDGQTGTKFYTNLMNPFRPLVIAMPESVVFDSYRWYTANDAEGRDPVAWTVETSADGVNWTVANTQNYAANQAAITTTRYALAGTWTLSDVAAMNVFSDISAMTVSAPGTLGVSGTTETVGALSGEGAVLLMGGGTLGINAFADAAFSGGITGTGTVVKTGTERQSLSGALAFNGTIIVEEGVLDLDGAVLTGVSNIIIRTGGELTGSATVNGNLTVTFEGGVYSGSLAVSGALTVVGTVNLGVPEGATYPFYSTLFSYAAADAASQAALVNAVKPAPIPSGQTAIVRVDATSARLVIAPVGTVICIR
jgi:autotransporter-associated beta strand protein